MMKLKHGCADGGKNEDGWGLFQVARLDVKPEKHGRLQMTQKRRKAAPV